MRDLDLHPTAYYAHFNQLLDCGYLSVERRKSCGKFDVSIYRLSHSVDVHTLSKSNQKSLSEKPAHGLKGGMNTNFLSKGELSAPLSEKAVHGKVLKASAPISEMSMSGKPLSEKPVYGNFGQAYINNNSTSNSFFEKKQVKNHQGSELGISVALFSLERTKEFMGYEDLRCEALAWGELKETLGHFSHLRDKARFIRKAIEILDELARQLHKNLNTVARPDDIIDVIASAEFLELFDQMLAMWDEVRSVKGYVEAVLRNVLK